MSDKPNEASIWQLHNHCQKEAPEDRLDYSKRLRAIALQWLLIPGVTAHRCFLSKYFTRDLRHLLLTSNLLNHSAC